MNAVNLNTLIAEAHKKLEAVGIDAGAAEAELILCDLLELDRLHLYLHGPSLIDDDLIARFREIIEKRRTRYPLQYILGSAWFYGRKFIVNEAVMVPCPETELLLESVIRTARQCRSEPVRVLDIGTGSGVLAISSKLENEDLDVTAVDISKAALAVARANAERFDIADDIRFLQSDLFGALGKGKRFHIIASNPPYIADGDYDGLPPEVKADPTLALLSGEKGLDIIRRMIAQAPDYLTSPGFLMFEIGYDQAQDIFDMVTGDARYSECSLLKDLSDIDRVVICKANAEMEQSV